MNTLHDADSSAHEGTFVELDEVLDLPIQGLVTEAISGPQRPGGIELIVRARDVRIVRHLGSSPTTNPTIQRRKRRIEPISRSLRRCREAARNMGFEPVQLLTLTYAWIWPSSDRVVKAHLSRFARKLRRRGIRAFWVREFQRRGAPHLHLWVSKAVPKELVLAWWLAAMGSFAQRGYREDQRVYVRRWNGGSSRAASYAGGQSKHRQRRVPEGYEDPGKSWGQIGRPTIERVSVGCEVVRALKRAAASKRRAGPRRHRRWRDDGRRGFVLWDLASFVRSLLERSTHGRAVVVESVGALALADRSFLTPLDADDRVHDGVTPSKRDRPTERRIGNGVTP